MIKTYRKTATIQAEQFDGSTAMMIRYQIDIAHGEYTGEFIGNKLKYLLYTLEGQMSLVVGDWVATGVKGEHWAIQDDVFKDSYVEVETNTFKRVSDTDVLTAHYRLNIMTFHVGESIEDLISQYPSLKHVIKYNQEVQEWVIFNDLGDYYLDVGEWVVIYPTVSCETQEDLYKYGNAVVYTDAMCKSLFHFA